MYDGHVNENNELDWAFINTVAERKEEYTKREYRDAVRARKTQNIIMFPGVQKLTQITNGAHVDNCPVTRSDIRVAEHIFGSNLGALKGKTVTKSSVPVSSKTDMVSRSIME
jgi:hypothetical protein